MKRLFIPLIIACLALTGLQGQDAQTIEQWKAEKAEKEGQVAALQGEIGAIKGQLDALPGWRKGAFGNLGFNLSSFDNWAKQGLPNSTSATIGASVNAFANNKQDKFFWNNSGNLSLAWQKLTADRDAPEAEDSEFLNVADVLRITSLYGRNISPKLAVSALGDYNTSVINNFNNPGILDIGAGITWLPIDNMVVVIHPLNYHIVMGDNPNFNSGLGAKFMVDYGKELFPGINWRTNLTSFVPYKSFEPSLFEYTWSNGIAFNVLGGIGVGIDFAIRQADIESLDGQSYFIIGLSYSL